MNQWVWGPRMQKRPAWSHFWPAERLFLRVRIAILQRILVIMLVSPRFHQNTEQRILSPDSASSFVKVPVTVFFSFLSWFYILPNELMRSEGEQASWSHLLWNSLNTVRRFFQAPSYFFLSRTKFTHRFRLLCFIGLPCLSEAFHTRFSVSVNYVVLTRTKSLWSRALFLWLSQGNDAPV